MSCGRVLAVFSAISGRINKWLNIAGLCRDKSMIKNRIYLNAKFIGKNFKYAKKKDQNFQDLRIFRFIENLPIFREVFLWMFNTIGIPYRCTKQRFPLILYLPQEVEFIIVKLVFTNFGFDRRATITATTSRK
jgi:hypothetical protein